MSKLGRKQSVDIRYPELMKFLASIPTEEERHLFAASCGTTLGYLRNAQYSFKKLGAEISVAIERNSAGRVTRKHLHPDEYRDIWPELK